MLVISYRALMHYGYWRFKFKKRYCMEVCVSSWSKQSKWFNLQFLGKLQKDGLIDLSNTWLEVIEILLVVKNALNMKEEVKQYMLRKKKEKKKRANKFDGWFWWYGFWWRREGKGC